MATTLTNSIFSCPLSSSRSLPYPLRSTEDLGSPVLTRHVCRGELPFDMVGPPPQSTGQQADGSRGHDVLDTIPSLGLEDTLGSEKQDLENNSYDPRHVSQTSPSYENLTATGDRPFHKWIKTLHKRATRRHEPLWWEGGRISHGMDVDGVSSGTGESGHRRQSSSASSFGFVTAVKSASISFTTASILSRSRRNTHRSSRGHSRADRSSRASVPAARFSEDSYCSDRPTAPDPAVIERSLQRRRILEELITTEESYIGDVRFLMNVYVTILASLTTLPAGLRSSINRNLAEIVELHEEMLGDLHRAVPHSEYTQPELTLHGGNHGTEFCRHQRWRSLDAVPEDNDGVPWARGIPSVLADPQTAAQVAKIFSKKMNRFFIYEEYGAKYELMIKDVASAHRTIPRWQSYQKGLEVLAASLGSLNTQSDHARRSLTIGDLLVKPIQRVCKYPLLFAELLKHTPVSDCPNSHMEIENALVRLREATAEINRATDDSRIKSVLEKTWILQDRLVFANQQLDAVSKNRIRSFGHIQLCGALHVCWQTKEGVSGQYMVALLYREWLCLAAASRFDQIYTIHACIALNNIKVEDVDNGRGLQCHTAPYSWKIVFICDHQLYEIILTACTPKEELEWRTRLSNYPLTDNQDQTQPVLFSSLSLNIKTLGTVFRKPGTIARRISIHRATTVGPKSPLYQVILKNTSVIKDPPSSGGNISSQINRSQSLLTTHSRIPVLAPSRGDRARLEALLSDVWTRDILPFPGITARSRSENIVRASASSVIRKLSVVSIANSFTKRSGRGGGGVSLVDDDSGSWPGLSSSPRAREFSIGTPLSSGRLAVAMTSTPASSQTGRAEEAGSLRSPSLLFVIPDEGERERGAIPSSLGTGVMNHSAAMAVNWERERCGGTEEAMLGMVRRLDSVWVRSLSSNHGSREILDNDTNKLGSGAVTSTTTGAVVELSTLLPRQSSAKTTISDASFHSASSGCASESPSGGNDERGVFSTPSLSHHNSAVKRDYEREGVSVETVEVAVVSPGITGGAAVAAATEKENVWSDVHSGPQSQPPHYTQQYQPRGLNGGGEKAHQRRGSRGWPSRRGTGGHREAVVQTIRNIFR